MNFFKRILPDLIISKITDLDDFKIKELKEKYGVEGLILDVDETLRYNMKPISEKNKEWIKNVLKSFKVIVISNGYDRGVNDFLTSINIEYITIAHKPFKRAFLNGADSLNLSPEKIMVVGDSLIDDILGGKLNKMLTTWVHSKIK